MTATLWSSHTDDVLYDLGWKTPAGTADQWLVLQRVFAALAAQGRVLGTLRGKLRFANDVPETWDLDVNAVNLLERTESMSTMPEPMDLTLDCEPLLWLTDNHLEVIDYDDDEFFSLGPATITPEQIELHDEPGMHPWRLRSSRVTLLSLEGSFGLSPFATSMGLQVHSGCDLWRSVRFDGAPNQPHGEANARLLARSVQEIVASTGGRIRRQP